MPFCTNCGAPVDASASYCGHCGARQPGAPDPFQHLFDRVSDRTAAILCYIPVFGVIPAIVFLASAKYRRSGRVRFNAFQALYLFVAWLIVASAAPTILFAGFPGSEVQRAAVNLLKLGLLLCWIYLLVKAAERTDVRLPVIGDLAARSASEQL